MLNVQHTQTPDVTECIVCNNKGKGAKLYPGILKCSECGFVYADMRLSDKELAALYSEGFFTGGEFSDYASDERFFRKNFRLRFKVLMQLLDSTRHRRLLEIGSAYGFFLDEVKGRFESVQGIDITDVGVRYARDKLGLDVFQGDFLARNYGDEKFDVVCMWDTIEHLRAPHEYIEKVASLSNSGALLAITTADIQSLNARMRAGHWRMIHPPTHLHYFSARTLELMLDRFGFDVIYNRYCGFYRSLGNVAYNVLVLRHRLPRWFRQIERTGLANIGFYLNLYDIMFVIARRR